jgi:hypothetical protein
MGGISGIDGGNASTWFQGVQSQGVQTQGVQTQGVQPAAGTTAAAAQGQKARRGGDGDDLSQAGQLFARLQSLRQADPAKFKATLQKIADTLRTQATSTDASQSHNQGLLKLAEAFQKAGDTGSLNGLQPGADATGKTHHHHARAYATQAAAAVANPAAPTPDAFNPESVINQALTEAGA